MSETQTTTALDGFDAFAAERLQEWRVPGQPPYELLPSGDTRFGLKGLQGYHITFTCDDGGHVIRAVFQQPNGEFSAKRK